jgi:uncharacterized protein YegL
MRRLPVYLLIDTSGSMRGEPIQAVNNGLKVLVNALRQDPYALESVHLGIITFDLTARELFPLTHLEQVQIPEIEVPQSGATFLGAALELLLACMERDLVRGAEDRKGDWRPLVFLMTDGSPSDIQAYENAVAAMKTKPFGNIVACAAGPKARQDYLKKLTDQVVSLDTLDGTAFTQFFKWVSASVAMGSCSAGTAGERTLPPPPAEVRLVL